MRHRREIRRVRFRENAIVRNESKKIIVAPSLERHDPAERDVPSDGDRCLGEIARPRKTVQHATNSGRSGFCHHCASVVFRVTRVDDYGLVELAGECELLSEGAPLLDARRVVVVIVQAALPNRYGAGIHQLAQLGSSFRRIESRCVVWMHARGVEDVRGITGGKRARLARRCQYVGRPASRADADYGAGPRDAGPLDYLVAVAGERRVGEVRVAVDEVWNAVVLRGHLRSIQSSTGLAM